MNSFFRHILLTFCAIVCFLSARADGNVTFEINTPLIVTAGEMFRVEFVLENGKPDGGEMLIYALVNSALAPCDRLPN